MANQKLGELANGDVVSGMAEFFNNATANEGNAPIADHADDAKLLKEAEASGVARIAPPKESFSQAFAAARKAGDKVFTFNGKKYTTEMKGEAKKPSTAPKGVNSIRASDAPQSFDAAKGKETQVPAGSTQTSRGKPSKPITETVRAGYQGPRQETFAEREKRQSGKSIYAGSIADIKDAVSSIDKRLTNAAK